MPKESSKHALLEKFGLFAWKMIQIKNHLFKWSLIWVIFFPQQIIWLIAATPYPKLNSMLRNKCSDKAAVNQLLRRHWQFFCPGVFAAAWRTSLTCLSSSPPTLSCTHPVWEGEAKEEEIQHKKTWESSLANFYARCLLTDFLFFRRFSQFSRKMLVFFALTKAYHESYGSWSEGAPEAKVFNVTVIWILICTFIKRENLKLLSISRRPWRLLVEGRQSSAKLLGRRKKFSAWSVGFMWIKNKKNKQNHQDSVMYMWKFPRSELISFGQGGDFHGFFKWDPLGWTW